jgi:amidohydrolase
MQEIIRLRRELHRHPELSGCEIETTGRIIRFFEPLEPDAVVDGIGGNGVAVVFEGLEPGPTVLLRAELDALPIEEENRFAHRSGCPRVGHLCGHDGHMAILAAVGGDLSARRPARGKVVLLFQPAEETGRGAAAVAADPRFAPLRPDFAFALHNLPGFSLGDIIIREGVFSSASRGVVITLKGKTAHAAQPETGSSPALAMSEIIRQLVNLPAASSAAGGPVQTTVVGARLGEKAFGTAPGRAEVWATLRVEADDDMVGLVHRVEQLVAAAAATSGLEYGLAHEDVFPATVNAPRAVELVRLAAGSQPVRVMDKPFAWSEDFGHLAALCDGALFGLGAGVEAAALHDPRYDFPDELIPIGADIFQRIIAQCLA